MRLVIGSPHGRSGKSTFTLGLIVALRERGLSVQPFKKGPDYIDPSWLSRAAGRPCRNLDLFFLEPPELKTIFARGTVGADIAIVEGAMGLFDGLDLEGSDSTAMVAKCLGAPVLLVVDATRMTRSVAALVQGFVSFDPDLKVGGVILNKVARPRHEDMLRKAIEAYTDVPVLGGLPRCRNIEIADRHLGLVPAGEMGQVEAVLASLGRAVEEYVDVARVIKLANQAAPFPVREYSNRTREHSQGTRIGVIKDHIFNFYYQENLEALEEAGAELVFIDSTASTSLPPVDALYIGGGFPEVYADELESNVQLRNSIRRAAASGLPMFAECGGLMYLARRLNDGIRSYEMAGALACETRMTSRPLGHGYTVLEVDRPNYLFERGATIKGHEFHHSHVVKADVPLSFCASVKRGYGCDGKRDGIVSNNVFASYCHIYAPACPEWAPNLVAAANVFRQRGRGGRVGRLY